MKISHAVSSGTPIIAGMHVIPVAGHDSMLFNLCGAHGPFFTRNAAPLGCWAICSMWAIA
jgi:glucarate dehydratase